MNNEIEMLFSNFIVPVVFGNYTGKEEKYVVYFSNGETPVFYGDDKVLASVNTYDFNIYTKGNYLNILNELKKILSDNGWNWVEDGEDIYEDDTHFFHKVTTWSKERIDFKWLK